MGFRALNASCAGGAGRFTRGEDGRARAAALQHGIIDYPTADVADGMQVVTD